MPAPRKAHTSRFAVSPLSLTITAQSGKQFAPYLRKHLKRAHSLLTSPLRELSLALVNNTTMSHLHHRYMNLATPTDVLTFELEHDARGRITAGEVIICLPCARTQARLRRIPLKNELLLYALHGMLHLSGYDDRTQRDFAKMHAKEDEILQKLGIGKVFAQQPASPRPPFSGGPKGRVPSPPKKPNPRSAK